MDKSVTIEVERRMMHPLFGRVIRSSSKIMAHDEKNEVGVGDLVQVMETRPLSKRKRWRLVQVMEKAK
jgi:small subunit ribosomal protein S17